MTTLAEIGELAALEAIELQRLCCMRLMGFPNDPQDRRKQIAEYAMQEERWMAAAAKRGKAQADFAEKGAAARVLDIPKP